jgi:hypothetical protein
VKICWSVSFVVAGCASCRFLLISNGCDHEAISLSIPAASTSAWEYTSSTMCLRRPRRPDQPAMSLSDGSNHLLHIKLLQVCQGSCFELRSRAPTFWRRDCSWGSTNALEKNVQAGSAMERTVENTPVWSLFLSICYFSCGTLCLIIYLYICSS